MAEGIENIGKKDVAWSYASTFFTVGAGIILLPFMTSQFSAETVGIWSIFQTIAYLTLLLDFGFRPSFARNLSYIFSGVKQLQREGVETVTAANTNVDYSLLQATINTMRRFYRWMTLLVFALLISVGTVYMHYILKKYTGDQQDAMIAWIMLILINCYNLYTFYYDALLTGKGYVKRIQQITILGQAVYLLVAVGLIFAGMGLTAIVSAQVLSVIIRRIIAYKVFYDKPMREHLKDVAVSRAQEKEVMKAIYPNAVKVGLTNLGGFLVNKSATLLGGVFLPLDVVAAYGISIQVLDIIGRCGTVIYQSYNPRMAQCRAENNLHELKRIYKYSILSLLAILIVGGAALVLWGDWALGIIGSETTFLPATMLLVMLVIYFLEHNHSVSAGFIMADNKIPFFIPSLVSGAATIILMWIFMQYCDMGVWGMILAPGIAQLAYQNWKWPSVVIKELKNA